MIGDKIRELREQNDILLRQLAAKLEIDTALLSKMERGDRFFRREDIEQLAIIFKQSKKELLTLWLANRIIKSISDEEFSREALHLAVNLYSAND